MYKYREEGKKNHMIPNPKTRYSSKGAKNFLDEIEGDVYYVITITVTVTDENTPELPPIHRHDVLGIADSTHEATHMLASAISNAGFMPSKYDTRIGRKPKKVIFTQRQHAYGLKEDFEWVVQIRKVNNYGRNE